MRPSTEMAVTIWIGEEEGPSAPSDYTLWIRDAIPWEDERGLVQLAAD